MSLGIAAVLSVGVAVRIAGFGGSYEDSCQSSSEAGRGMLNTSIGVHYQGARQQDQLQRPSPDTYIAAKAPPLMEKSKDLKNFRGLWRSPRTTQECSTVAECEADFLGAILFPGNCPNLCRNSISQSRKIGEGVSRFLKIFRLFSLQRVSDSEKRLIRDNVWDTLRAQLCLFDQSALIDASL